MASCSPDCATKSAQLSAAEALALLERALDIIDGLALPANVGARLTEAIDALVELR